LEVLQKTFFTKFFCKNTKKNEIFFFRQNNRFYFNNFFTNLATNLFIYFFLRKISIHLLK